MQKDSILESIRFFESRGKNIHSALYECSLINELYENDSLNSEDNEERQKILNAINNDDYVRNDYDSFLTGLMHSKRNFFLTPYTAEDFKNDNVQTYQVNGYEIGFALKPMQNGDVDIISVHNNTGIGGLGDALIQSAIRLGGTTLDHFDGYLSDLYRKHGFEEYERYKWDDQYAPENWDYKKYGTPDVIMRRLGKS